MVLILAAVLTLIFIYESRLKLTNHLIALIVPWFLILIFSKYDISYLRKELEIYTYVVIFSFIIFYYLGYKFVQIFYRDKPKYQVTNIGFKNLRFDVTVSLYLVLTILNIAIAGYIPLVSLILTGNSGYMDFGISGLYGFYNAFANALGILCYFLFLKTKNYKYLAITTFIFLVFILFMTRQNFISLLVEMFIIYSFVRKEINYFRGSEDDVLKRVVEAAEHFSIQNIIELHGDNPFLDPDIIDSCIREFELGDVDYLSNTLENTFPQGLRVQIFPTIKLRRVEKTVDDETVREHVSLYFYKNPNKFKIKSVEAEDPIKRPELRLTVDTEEDFQFICNIYERILLEGIYPDFDVKDIIRIVDDYKISILNKSINSKPIR